MYGQSNGDILKEETPAVDVCDLRVRFRRRRRDSRYGKSDLIAVDDVSLRIGKGEILGLVGESGCGKTTLARAILGLVPFERGEVRLNGVDISRLSAGNLRKFRPYMQLVFQDPLGSLNPRMSVSQIVGGPMLVHGLTRPAEVFSAVQAVLLQVGLDPEMAFRFPHELSGGQRQRVNIARALAVRPGVVVCDEPVSALDATAQIEIMELLIDLKTRLNLSYLFITHNIGLAQTYCDRIAVMYSGKIVEVVALVNGAFQPHHPYTIALCESIPQPDPTLRGGECGIAGDIPLRVERPGGCVFHPRCPLASDLCRLEMPRLEGQKGLSDAHWVACHEVNR